MTNSFISLMTKAVTNWKIKDGSNKDEKLGNADLNYYDAVSTPDLTSSTQDGNAKIAIMKSNIKDEMSAFFLETSFTALTQIYKANSLWKRVVWTVLVIGMLAWMAVQCFWLLDRYYNYPIEVKMDLKVSMLLEFPSVTICNLNPILDTKVVDQPYLPLMKYVDPEAYDLLFKETLANWKFEDVCLKNDYKCDNGRCISENNVCDGWTDCMDGEDELACEDHNCTIYFWKCTSTQKCIHISSICDGFPGACNINDTEDEDNCQNNTCPGTFFRCNSGQCIPNGWVCDHYDDCDNDEFNCPEVMCKNTSIKCNNTNRCIRPRDLCDGYNDCKDKEDESFCPWTNTTGAYNDSGTSLQPTTAPSSFTTSPTTSRENNGTTPTPSSTKDFVRRRREASDHFLTDDTNDETMDSNEWLHLYREHADLNSPDTDMREDSILRDSKMRWDVISNSDDREHFIRELYDSYIDFQKSEILNNKQKKDTEYTAINTNNKAHHRVKRQIRPTAHVKNSSLVVDWKAVLQNASFNKWDMLANAAMSAFYEERDEEYEATMTYAYITAKLNPVDVEQSGHLKKDLIAACRFGGYQCSPANFTYFHSHKYGNCYTFNSKFANGSILNTRFPGPENGLRLELFLNQEKYVANLAAEAGVRILVHKKGSMPFPEDEGISVMPGRSTAVGIRQVSFTRLPPPHGVCSTVGKTMDYYGFYLGTEYSKLACLKSCYQDVTVKYCHCAVPFYFVLNNVTVCNMTDRAIEDCVTNLPQSASESFEICDKLCPVPCMETKYDMSISTAKWPSDKYKNYLQERLGQTNALYRQENDSENEFTKLQIYFQDLIYEHVEQQKAYESMNLISDLGGQLGLWLGLSAITIGEICSFLFGVGRSLSFKCWGNKTTPIQNDLTPIINIEPATLKEMYDDMYPEAAKYVPPDGMTTTLSGSTYA